MFYSFFEPSVLFFYVIVAVKGNINGDIFFVRFFCKPRQLFPSVKINSFAPAVYTAESNRTFFLRFVVIIAAVYALYCVFFQILYRIGRSKSRDDFKFIFCFHLVVCTIFRNFFSIYILCIKRA